MGVGMIVCGMVTDRLTRTAADPQVDDRARLRRAVPAPAAPVRFRAGPGPLQLLLIAAGAFFAAGTTGPAGAMVAT